MSCNRAKLFELEREPSPASSRNGRNRRQLVTSLLQEAEENPRSMTSGKDSEAEMGLG